MNRLVNLIGRRPSVPAVRDKNVVADKIASPKIVASPPEPEKLQKAIELDNELFLPIASQLGEDNESIRDLLIDAVHKINELDAIKRAIGKYVEPVSKTLRALQEAKSELSTSETKVTMLESECSRLEEALTVTQQRLTALESAETEQTAERAARRAQVAALQGRVLQQKPRKFRPHTMKTVA